MNSVVWLMYQILTVKFRKVFIMSGFVHGKININLLDTQEVEKFYSLLVVPFRGLFLFYFFETFFKQHKIIRLHLHPYFV